MAEANFTSSIKKRLAEHLASSGWLEEPYQAIPEYYVTSRGHRNLIDVAILDPKDECRLVGIELEVYSNQDQVIRNWKRFKEWTTASPNRVGGLLHVILDRAYISQDKMYHLLMSSYSAIASGSDFYYELMTLEPDYRASKETARYLVEDSWEFDARLWALMKQVLG